MKRSYRWNQQDIALDVSTSADGLVVVIADGSTMSAQVTHRTDGTIWIQQAIATKPGDLPTVRVVRLPAASDKDGIEIAARGTRFQFSGPSGVRSHHKAETGSGSLIAPMSGVVADVLVHEGEIVMQGQALLIIEAMKVMTTIEAPFAGSVSSIHAATGGRVEHGAVVINIVKSEPE